SIIVHGRWALADRPVTAPLINTASLRCTRTSTSPNVCSETRLARPSPSRYARWRSRYARQHITSPQEVAYHQVIADRPALARAYIQVFQVDLPARFGRRRDDGDAEPVTGLRAFGAERFRFADVLAVSALRAQNDRRDQDR